MKVSMNWLKDLVDVDVDVDELSALFNKHSAEVEEYYKLVEASGLVVGHVVEKEKHPDADKLSVCQVNIGSEISQIVCGAPNVDKGQNVIVALPGAVLPGGFKIKKSTIRGVDSNGMICSLSELGIDKKYHAEEGIHVLSDSATPGSDPVKELLLNDEVMVLDLTPNRADLLSVLGVAYDTAALLDKEITLQEYIVQEDEELNNVTIKIDTKNCYSYHARVIKDIVIGESPRWMQSRLIAAGMRPISNVVDITNYVMLETGQPLHAFDYDLLDSDTITVRMATNGEEITTLDSKERKLTENDIVITNDKVSVALGGVMGGYSTEVVSTSNTILLESAEFSPVHIRRTSNRLDLRSEASTRFERKIDPNRTLLALEMATTLLVEYAGGNALKGISYVDNADKEEKVIEITLSKINSVLGSNYDLDKVSDTLDSLNFEYEINDGNFSIKAPTRRQDIITYQDIIEEVGRIIGYDLLPLSLPKTVSVGKLSEYQVFKRKVKNTLNGLGLNEVVTYALINENNVYDFVKEKVDTVTLSKPLSADRSVLSLTPINGVIDVLKHNMARKISDLAVYEIGTKYTKGKETALLCGAITGNFSNTLWQGTKEVSDFFLLKGILLSLFDETSLSHLEFVPSNEYKNLHPGQTASIKDRSGEVGFIGKLHPEYAKNNDLKDTFIFELDLEKIFNLRRVPKKVKEINKYPIMSRDIAIVVGKEVVASELLSVINKAGKRMLLSSSIFDLYVGDSIGKDNKSLAIRLEFSDNNKTLEAKDVDDRVRSILGILKASFNAELR